MQENYIYLDWNVIQYAKNPRQGRLDEDLLPLIRRISRKYRFPYSESHLRDLASGYRDETKGLVKDDLKFLSEITNSKALVFLTDTKNYKEFIAIQHRNCEKDFATILDEIKKEGHATMDPPSNDGIEFPIETSKLDQDDIFLKHLENNDGNLNSPIISQVLKSLWDNEDDPDVYKNFRHQVQKLTKHLEERPNTLIAASGGILDDITPFLRYLSLKKKDEIEEAFLPALVAFAKLSGRNFEKLSIPAKIELAYGLLDFQKYFSEKITKKNRASNQTRDLNHLIFASNAKIFVTEDAGSLVKSRLVIRALGMSVKALNVSEFIARFS